MLYYAFNTSLCIYMATAIHSPHTIKSFILMINAQIIFATLFFSLVCKITPERMVDSNIQLNMSENRTLRRRSNFSASLDQNINSDFNSNLSRSVASTSTIQNRIINHLQLQDSERPSTSNNNLHIRDASSLITGQQPPSYEGIRRDNYLLESRAALLFPPVATCLYSLLIALYFGREYLNVFSEEYVYVSWKKVFKEKQIWRLFVAQFFHFSRGSVIISVFTLYAIGRYLERKLASVALLSVIMCMSALCHLLYIFLNPLCCSGEQTEFIWGFGNIVYGLRVLLAYAMEPRNQKRDLVFGLYPMVLSANAAPWQPVMDLIIFNIVLPEQCITGQLSGILAGFIVTFFLLIWPNEGIYVANPPYFWGSDQEPGTNNSSNDNRRGSRFRRSSVWRMDADDFFTTPPSDTDLDPDTDPELNQRETPQMRNNNGLTPTANALHRSSNELKNKISQFYVTAKESYIKKLGKGENKEHCKLIHKRRRKKRTTASSRRSSGSVSSIDPDCLCSDFETQSDKTTPPTHILECN